MRRSRLVCHLEGRNLEAIDLGIDDGALGVELRKDGNEPATVSVRCS